ELRIPSLSSVPEPPALPGEYLTAEGTPPMFAQLTAVVIDPDPSNREEMSAFLTTHKVEVSSGLPGLDAMEKMLTSPTAPKLVVVTLDPAPWETLATVGKLIRRFPETLFFVLSHVLDPKLLMDAIR